MGVQEEELTTEETEERVFMVNRPAVFLYISGLVAAAVGLVFIFLVASNELASHDDLIGKKLYSAFMVFVSVVLLAIAAALAESLIKTLYAGDPALIISNEGVRYRFVSDDLMPWGEIRRASIIYKAFGRETLKEWGTEAGVRLILSPDLSELMCWRGKIYNAYKPNTVTVNFLFIDATKTELAEAFLRARITPQ